MKIDIFQAPPPLEFGTGDQAFKLHLKRFTGAERQAVIDAIRADSLDQVQREIESLVIAWDNVLGADGNPLPFEAKDEKGRLVRNISRFMGAIPLAMQLEVIAGVLVFMGIPRGEMDDLIKSLTGVTGTKPEVDPTSEPGGATPPPASSE